MKVTKIKEICIFKGDTNHLNLKDGNYLGIWGGYTVTVDTIQGRTFELTVDEGVRGVGYKVMVTVKDGEMSFVELDN